MIDIEREGWNAADLEDATYDEAYGENPYCWIDNYDKWKAFEKGYKAFSDGEPRP